MVFSLFHSDLARRAVPLVAITLAVFALLNVAGWFAYLTYKNHFHPTIAFSANAAGPLPEKKAYYLAQRNNYNALFLGDSRTLCGMHPDFIDPIWHRRSYNLAHWATWMPMQYALISDIAAAIPPDTIVVWSLGHENFRKQVIRAVYPIGWHRIPDMILQGYPAGELITAQLAFTPATALVGRSSEFFDHVHALMGKEVIRLLAENKNVSAEVSTGAREPLDEIGARPLTAYVEPWRDDQGRLVSVAQYKINGAMARIETVPEFYRAKQTHDDSFSGFNVQQFTADSASMASFVAILEIFKAAGIRLIVNEIEEAPYMYENAGARQAYRDWMRAHIRPVVEEYGFTYIGGNAAHLNNKDYFDYNHLNEHGARAYDAAVGRALKKAVGQP
jgi:hypothetical protein